MDKTVTYKTRYEKAIDYFNRSKDLYEDYGHIDIISNLYVSLAKTYDMMNKTKRGLRILQSRDWKTTRTIRRQTPRRRSSGLKKWRITRSISGS